MVDATEKVSCLVSSSGVYTPWGRWKKMNIIAAAVAAVHIIIVFVTKQISRSVYWN